MDRAAKLAADASVYVAREITSPGIWIRESTRDRLAEIAESLGYSTELEISAAVDQALKDAGSTP